MKTETMRVAVLALSVGLTALAQGHEHEHGHDHAKGVEVSDSAARSMGLRTVRVERRRMRSTVTLTGRMELSPDARRTVAAPLAGRLVLKVKPLQAVEKGAVLFTLSAPELGTRAQEIRVLEKRLEVYRELGSANAELEAQLKLRRAEREAMLNGAEEKDSVVLVRSASAGMVESLSANEGAWVESGAAVIGLVRPQALRFRAVLAASEAARLREGMTVELEGVRGSLRLGIGDSSGTVPAYALFAEGSVPKRAGERASVVCVTDETETPVRAVPSACLVRIGLEPTVFVRDEHDPDRYLAVKVEPGVSGGGWTEVRGLPDDDDLEVVREGAYELKLALAAQAGTKSAGHFHADGTFHEGKDE